MNNLINNSEIKEINLQLGRADLLKNKLIKNIFKEYEYYLKLIRNLLLVSVEKGVKEIYSNCSLGKIFLNSDQLSKFFEKKINYFIETKLPLITIEQLKINAINDNIIKEGEYGGVEESIELKEYYRDSYAFEENLISDEPLEFQINNDISYSYEYYQSRNYQDSFSLDFDGSNLPYSSKTEKIGNNLVEKRFSTALLELLEEDNSDKEIDFKNLSKDKNDLKNQDQNLDCFNLIDNNLSNLLLDLSYGINLELFKSNLLKKIISEDSFEYLSNKKYMIKHPFPFVINIDPNLNNYSKSVVKLPNIFLFNLNIVELEFYNINLSIQRNKINQLKSEFSLLTKKERYWRQKSINLNKIQRKK